MPAIPVKLASRRIGGSKVDIAQPTVLLVGGGEPMTEAISVALGRHGFFVESADAQTAVDSVKVTAPDLVLLLGDATHEAGRVVLEKLAMSVSTSVVPAVLLTDETSVDAKLRAFRNGAAAVVPRLPSADAIAAKVAELAREIPQRLGDISGEVGEATFDELVEALSRELRSGVLSVRGNSPEAIRLVLGKGRRVAKVVDDFVARLKPLVVHAEPLHYEFDQHAAGAVQLLGEDAEDPGFTPEQVRGLRVLLADDDSGRADAMAQALRALGAMVLITDLEGRRLGGISHLDPQVVVIGERDVQGRGYELLRALKRDPRLRWASLVVVAWEELWTHGSDPNVSRLVAALCTVTEHDRALSDRIARGESFDTRLEISGPGRLLRSLCAADRPVRAVITNPRATIYVDFAEALVVGARAELKDEEARTVEGPAALAALLVIGSGRAHVEARERPEMTNVMAPVDAAINLAAGEKPPLAPSLAPARMIAEVSSTESSGASAWSSVPAPHSELRGYGGEAEWSEPPTYPRIPLSAARRASERITQPRDAYTDEGAPDLPTLPPPARVPAEVIPSSVVGETSSVGAIELPGDPGAARPAPPRNTVRRRTGAWVFAMLLGAALAGGAVAAVKYFGPLRTALALAPRPVVAVPNPAMAGAQSRELALPTVERVGQPSSAEPEAESAESASTESASDPATSVETAPVTEPTPADKRRTLQDALDRATARPEPELPEMPPKYKLNPDALRVMREATRFGETMLGKRKLGKAQQAYEQAIRIYPRNAAAHMGLGLVALERGDPAAAREHFRNAVALHPDSALFYYYLGRAYEVAGDKPTAISRYRYAYQLDPKNVQARLALGIPIRGKGKNDKRSSVRTMRPTGI